MKQCDGVIGVILERTQNQVLLVKRRDVPVWVLPGGGIEDNETPPKAVVREVEEETGYKVKIIKKVAEYSYRNSKKKNHIFECKIVGGKAQTGTETKDIRFYTLTQMPELRDPMIDDWINITLIKRNEVIKKTVEGVTIRHILKHLFKHPIPVIRFLLVKVGIRINT